MTQQPNNNLASSQESLSPNQSNLDDLVANTCFCKLRTFCPDKTSEACMRHQNIYQAFMLSKK